MREHTYSVKQVRELVNSFEDKEFVCIFRKRSGAKELRKMICKLGVTEGVKGIGMSYDPKKYDLLNVYDVEKKEFRMVNLRTIMQIVHGEDIYFIKHDEDNPVYKVLI
ncbi:MAG: hypothetical protein NC816_00785 [Candidatus Omnitrophica bacterium]|nr:hypothetical protein [Candidatus Omnitrophota bacterium]